MVVLESPDVIDEVQTLMGMALCLGEFTQFPGRLDRIPGFLSQSLGIPRISIAVLRHRNECTAPAIVHVNSSVYLAEEPALAHAALDLYRHSSPFWERPPAADELTPACNYIAETMLPAMPHCPRTTLFAHWTRPPYRTLLVVHHRVTEVALPRLTARRLSILTKEIAHQVGTLIECRESPRPLGKPFESLSEPEWRVLRGLNTDMCEKQLAANLQMRPHTLHSHIKSIYRKIGVQGRLPLINHFQATLRQIRVRSFNIPSAASATISPRACQPDDTLELVTA